MSVKIGGGKKEKSGKQKSGNRERQMHEETRDYEVGGKKTEGSTPSLSICQHLSPR